MHACSQSSGFKTMHLICIARFIKLLVLVKLIFYSQNTEKNPAGLHLDCFQSIGQHDTSIKTKRGMLVHVL